MKKKAIQKKVQKQIKKNKKPLLLAVGAAVVGAAGFVGAGLRKAFKDMKEDAQAQHEVDRAEFAAVRAESRANWEEAGAMSRPSTRRQTVRQEQSARITAAEQRQAEAEERIRSARH